MISIRMTVFGCFVGLILALAGCAQPTDSSSSPLGQTTPPSNYPVTTLDPGNAAYPGADTAPSTVVPPIPTATVNAQLGRLKGKLLLRGEPVANYGLYLGELLKDQAGQEAIVALDMAASPSSFTGIDGSFEIVNIPLGDYGLVLVTVKDSFHLLYPDRKESLIVRVTDSQVLDLGTLDYTELPITQP